MSFDPTPEQQAIVDFIDLNANVNVQVDARAGAAKTSTIVLAAQKVGPQYTPLAVAFNKKNAEDLASRLPNWWNAATLNSLGHRAWASRLSKRLIVDADKTYKLAKAVLGEATSELPEDVLSEVLALVRGAKSIGLIPRDTKFACSLYPDNDTTWDNIGESKGLLNVTDEGVYYAREVLNRSIAAAWKGEIDYDDQIYMSVLFGGQYATYHTVVVDESQDLSPLNHIQLQKLTGTRLIAVGDPHQAIYAFRGADADSMLSLANLMQVPKAAGGIGSGNFKRLGLTKSFRVPHSISARQTEHVPDFGSMDFLPEGEIEFWPKPEQKKVFKPEGDPEVGMEGFVNSSWSVDDIPTTGAILCRNNAPLMALAFAMIKQRRPVKIMGRDIGASIATLLLKITGKKSLPVEKCYPKLEEWKVKEVAKAGDSESKLDAIYDRYDALHVLLDAGGKPDNLESAAFIRELFSDRPGESSTILSSIHRAKGMEWDWVMMLEPNRIPSNFAYKAQRRGDFGPIIQEYNLRYVGETRSKGTLVFADLDDCLEIGE